MASNSGLTGPAPPAHWTAPTAARVIERGSNPTAKRAAEVWAENAGVPEVVLNMLQSLLAQAEDDVLKFEAVPGLGLAVVLERDGIRGAFVIEIPNINNGLSPRESQIARMVAEGATNRAVADALEISLWTVSTHLRRIFAKLGVSSRAEMVTQLYALPHLPKI